MAKKYLSTTPQAEKWLRKSELLYKQAEDLRKEHKYKKAKELEQEAGELRAKGLEARAKVKLPEIESAIIDAAELPSISEQLWNEIKIKCEEVEEAYRRNPKGGANISLVRRFNKFPAEWDNLFEAFHDWVITKFQNEKRFFEFIQDVEDESGYSLLDSDTWYGDSEHRAAVTQEVYRALKIAEDRGVEEAEEFAELIKARDEILEEYDDINSEFMS